MADALPIPGVGIGLLSRYGVSTIRNSAATIAPEGLNSCKVSLQNAVYFDGQTGGVVLFSFDQPYAAPSSLNTPFIFGGEPLVSGVRISNQTAWGRARVWKAAFDFSPFSVNTQTFGRPEIWGFIANGGAAVDFSFSTEYDVRPTALNTPFNFGGQLVISGLSLGLQAGMSTGHLIEKPLQLLPIGIPARIMRTRPRVGFIGDLLFAFEAAYERPSGINAAFHFGDGGIVCSAPKLHSLVFGTPALRNTAQSTAPQSFTAFACGRNLIYDAASNGAGVSFHFMAPYTAKSAVNVPFYFAGLLRPNPIGFDATQYGTFTIASNKRFYQWTSIPPLANQVGVPRIWLKHAFVRFATKGPLCTEWGTAQKLWNLRQVFKSPFIIGTVFGNTTYTLGTPQVKPATFIATEFGLSAIANVAQSCKPDSIIGPEVGLHGFMLWRSIYNFHGWDATEFGDFTHRLGTPQLRPESFLPFRYGYATLRLAAEAVIVLHFQDLKFGTASIELASPSKIPDGIDSLAFGNTTIENAAQSFRPFGIRSLIFSNDLRLSLGARNFTPVPFNVSAYGRCIVSLAGLNVSGTHVLTFGNSRLSIHWRGIPSLNVAGTAQTQWGQIRVVSSLFVIEPETFNDTEFGQAALAGGNALVGKGHDFFVSGTPKVVNKSLSFTPEGFEVTHAFGTPSIRNLTPIVYPLTFTGMWFGNHKVENAAQAIYLVPIANLKFGKFYPWAVTQIAYPPGMLLTLFGIHRALNKTETVIARPLYSFEWGRFTVRNAARVLFWRGVVHTLFGNHKLWNNNQIITCSGFGRETFGLYRIWLGSATVAPESFGAPSVGKPTIVNASPSIRPDSIVSLRTGSWKIELGSPSIAPFSITELKIGGHEIWLKTPSLAPKMPPQLLFGDWKIRLVTPSLRPDSVFDPQYGEGSIRLANPSVVPTGIQNQFIVGRPTVTLVAQSCKPVSIDRLLFGPFFVELALDSIAPAGFDTLWFGRAAARLSTRYLGFSGVSSEKYGTFEIKLVNLSKVIGGLRSLVFGEINVANAAKALKPAHFDKLIFGAISIELRGLHVASFGGPKFGTCKLELGTPSLIPAELELFAFGEHNVRNKNFSIEPAGLFVKEEYGKFKIELVTPSVIPEPIVGEPIVGEPTIALVSPSVIPFSFITLRFGVAELVLAAQGCTVVSFVEGKFGLSTIELASPSVVPTAFDACVFGRHELTLKAVSTTPAGIRSFIMPIEHVVVNAARALKANGLGTLVFGQTSLDLAAKSFTPFSLIATIFGNNKIVLEDISFAPDGIYRGFVSTGHFIENVIKTIAPKGLDLTAYGKLTEIRNVSHTIAPESIEFTEYGAHEIELVNPSVVPDGIESRILFGTPDIASTAQSFKPWGMDKLAFTTPNIRLVTPSFAPFGIYMQPFGRAKFVLNTQYAPLQGFDSFRHVGYTAIRLASPSRVMKGINSLLFGQPDLILAAESITPDYFCKQSFGAATIELRTPHVASFGEAVFGTAAIELVTPSIIPGKFDLLLFGEHKVQNKTFSMSPEGMEFKEIYGEFTIELVTPSVTPESIVGKPVFGRPTIALVSPSICPFPFMVLRFGLTTVELAAQGCTTVSIAERMFGRPSIELASPSVIPKGILGTEYGLCVIDLVAETVAPGGIRSYIMPITHSVVNAARALYANGLNTLVFGQTSFELAADSFTPRGMLSSEFGLQELTLKDLSFSPDGIYRGYVSANHYIENVKKTIAPEGLDLTTYGELTEIANVAHTIEPKDVRFGEYGEFEVELANPSVVPVGVISNVQYGRPVVRLDAQSCMPWSIDKSVVTAPNICLTTLSFTPEGFSLVWFGRARFKLYTRYLDIHGIASYQYGGYAEIKLATPSRKMGGLASLVFGTTTLELGARNVTPRSFEKPLFGQAWISLRWLFPEGVFNGEISTPAIRLVTPSLYVKPIESMSFNEFRIWLVTPSAEPKSIFSDAYGQIKIENAMPEITPESIVCETIFGEPAVRNVSPSITPFPFIVTRFGPITIALDSIGCVLVPIVELRFGKLVVKLASPSVVPPGVAPSNNFGDVLITLAAKDAKVKGFDSLKFEYGLTTIANTARVLRAQGVIHIALGQPTIINAAQSFTPRFIKGPEFGVHEVVNDAKAATMRGFDALGTSDFALIVNQNKDIRFLRAIPFVEFGEHLVKLAIPFVQPDSIYDTWFMDPTIELANPSVIPAGFDAFVPGSHELTLVAQGIFAEGLDANDEKFGRHDIWLWAKSFTPDGIAPPIFMQFNKLELYDRVLKAFGAFQFAFGGYAEVKLANPSRKMKGIFSTLFGQFKAENAARSVSPGNMDLTRFGIHWFQNMWLHPAPFGDVITGLALIELANPSVVPRGIDSFYADLHYIKNEFLSADFRGRTFTEFGKWEFTQYPQYFTFGDMVVAPELGTPTIFRDEAVPGITKWFKPFPFNTLRFGSFWLANAAKGAAPVSIVWLRFGNTRVKNAALNFTPKGMFYKDFGVAWFRLTARLLWAKSFVALEYGLPAVGGNMGWFGPVGFFDGSFGLPFLEFKHRTYRFTGYHHFHAGQPKLWNAKRVLTFFSEYPLPLTQWGLPEIHIADDRTLRHATFGFHFITGTQLVAHSTRWLEQHEAYKGGFVGAPLVAFRHRRYYMPWFGGLNIGVPKVYRFVPCIMWGIDSLEFGRHRQTFGNMLYPEGFTDQHNGEARVSRSPRVLGVTQRQSNDVVSERTKVFNSRQYLTFANQEEYYTRGAIGNPWIWNQFKEVYMPGLSSMRFPVQFSGVYNKARIIEMPGLLSTRWMTKNGFIAFAIRYVVAGNINTLFIPTNGLMLHNAAHAIVLKKGINQFEMPSRPVWIYKTRRYLQHHTGSNTIYGTAFIADAIRTVRQARNNSFLNKFGTPLIGLMYYPVQCIGIEPPPTGFFFVTGPFKRGFTPRWQHKDFFGNEARVKNFNPQVWFSGRPFFEASVRHWISHAPRTIEFTGLIQQVFSKFSIRDRRQTTMPEGLYSFDCPRFTRVFNTVPDPIPVHKVNFDGRGIWECSGPGCENLWFGEPSLRYNMIQPEGIDFLSMGEAVARSMGVLIRNLHPSLWFGDFKVDSKQYIVFGTKTDDRGRIIGTHIHTVWGWPRVSPHTIWMRLDTPGQARQNHPETLMYELIGYREPEGYMHTKYPWWGHTHVDLRNRRIYHRHTQDPGGGALTSKVAPSSRCGEPTFAGFAQYVVFEKGIGGRYMGVHIVNPRRRKLMHRGETLTEFGESKIDTDKVFICTIEAKGFSNFVFSSNNIELLNRQIKMGGTHKLVFGDNTPMVHFPRHVYQKTYDATKWGVNWASTNPRTFIIEGFESFEDEWTVFSRRMFVKGGVSREEWLNKIRPNNLIGIIFGTHFVQPDILRVGVYMIPPPCIPCCGHTIGFKE